MTSDEVWNRAAMESGGSTPGPGDSALADLLRLHSLAMSSGLLSAFELCSTDGALAAANGYRYFGLDDAASVVEWLATELETLDPDQEELLEALELEADRRYGEVIPADGTIDKAFQQHFQEHPDKYAPLD
jgi:hypothetical protein